MNTLEQISNDCPYCQIPMRSREMECCGCGVAVRADFPSTPLTDLPTQHQRFIEMFVLASGNLKEIASLAGVSYPTVRNRLDKVIEALRTTIERQPQVTDESRAGPLVNQTGGATPRPAHESAAEIIKRI